MSGAWHAWHEHAQHHPAGAWGGGGGASPVATWDAAAATVAQGFPAGGASPAVGAAGDAAPDAALLRAGVDPAELVLWGWYALMCLFCCVGNLLLLAAGLVFIRPAKGDAYGAAMKLLAVPWVWDCAWRSVFPSLYLQRFVFWDTPLNAVIVDRTWACLGELAWSFQIGLAIRQASGWALFVLYVVAECVSYYNTATTNEFWAAAEVVVDGLSFLVAAPACIYLLIYTPGRLLQTSGKFFVAVMSVVAIVYPLYNIVIDAPMYLQRYAADQAANKTYFTFLAGLEDACVRRIPTHNLTDWQGDMGWMTAYFSAGAWTGMLLMFAPRYRAPATPVAPAPAKEAAGGVEAVTAVAVLVEGAKLEQSA